MYAAAGHGHRRSRPGGVPVPAEIPGDRRGLSVPAVTALAAPRHRVPHVQVPVAAEQSGLLPRARRPLATSDQSHTPHLPRAGPSSPDQTLAAAQGEDQIAPSHQEIGVVHVHARQGRRSARGAAQERVEDGHQGPSAAVLLRRRPAVLPRCRRHRRHQGSLRRRGGEHLCGDL